MNDADAKQQAVAGECPSRDTLADLALGKLPSADIDQLGQHVEGCSVCQRVLESLDGLEDSVIADIKGQSRPLPPSPALEEQIRAAEQISRVVWQEPPANVAEEPLPARLGQYEVLERIGRGGMGTVYKAHHPHLKRTVAVKVLPLDRLRDPQAVARFQREMEAVGRLDHPHLVRAHDAGEADGRHFLVMEFVDGTDLRKLVREHGPLPVADACEIIHQAALGLQYAHEHGLVHRDIKPSNIMLTNDGTVKVLDLGLARLMDEAASVGDMTSAGQIVGTGDFMAPEQGQDTRNADARSDIYSLGCTLYFLLAGRAPFSGPQYETFGKKLVAHAQEPIPPIQAIRNDVPEVLVSIIEKMTAKAPEQRFQAAAEVAEALASIGTSSDQLRFVLGREPSTLEVGEKAGASRSRTKITWLLAALALLIPAVLVGLWLGRGLRSKQPAAVPSAMADHEFLDYLRHEQDAAQKAVDDIVQPDLRKMEASLAESRRRTNEHRGKAQQRLETDHPVQNEGQP